MADLDTRRNDAPISTRRVLQVLATVSVLDVLWLFVSAGQLFPRGEPDDLHSWGAVVLHVTTGLVTIAAGVHWRATRGPVWPTLVAGATFVLSFVQGWFGAWPDLYLHIPGALVLAVGSVWVMAWSFTGADDRHRAQSP